MRVLCLAFLLAACGPGSALREPDEYTGCSTDENWVTFDDQEPFATLNDSQSPVVTVTSPAAHTVHLAWNRSPGDVGTPDGDVLHDGPSCNMCCEQWNLGVLTTLHELFIFGDVFDLQFRLDGATAMFYRVLTTLQEWESPPSVGAAWAGHSVSLKIYRLGVLLNDPKSGPFVGTSPTTFTAP